MLFNGGEKMENKELKILDFLKETFILHFKERKFDESHERFADDAEICGLLPSGSIHGMAAIKAAFKTFLTFSNVNWELSFSDENVKNLAEFLYSVRFLVEMKNIDTEQVITVRTSAIIKEFENELKISSLDISIVDRNSVPTRYFIDSVELGYENELYRDVLGKAVGAGILGCYNEPNFPLYAVDDNLVRVLGYKTKKELLAEIDGFVGNIIYHEDLVLLEKQYSQYTEVGMKYESKYRVKTHNGRYIWVKEVGKTVKAYDKIVLVSVCYDINELVEQKKKTKDFERRFNIAIGGAEILTWEYDIINKSVRYPQGNEPGKVGREVVFCDYPERIFKNKMVIEEQVDQLRDFYDKVENGDENVVKGSFWVVDGSSNAKKCCEITYSIIRDKDGKAIYAHGLSRDITKQKFTEKRYKEEIEFREKKDGSIISTCCLNLTLGIVENLRYAKSYIKDEKILNIRDYRERSKFFLDDTEMTDEQTQKVSFENLLSLFEQGITEVKEEYIAVLKETDERVWIRLDVNIVKSPRTGNVLAFFYNSDITKEKTIELVSAKVLEQNYIEVGIVNIERDTYSRFYTMGKINSRFSKTVPHTPSIDIFCEKRVVEKERKRVKKCMSIPYIKENIEKYGICEFQFLSIDDEGNESYNAMVMRPLYKNNNSVLISTRSNIDVIVRESQKKQKRLEKAIADAKKANNAKTDFFAGISHDMRTPMNAIIGLSALGFEESKDELIKKYFLNIDSSAHFLLGLINDALDSSQIEKNALKLKYEPYSAIEFNQYVNSMVNTLCEAKKIDFNMTISKECAEYINTDKLRFNQIFFNLLSNAIKFTPENGKIDFNIEFVSRNEGVVVQKYVVKDTGIGMSKEFQKQMFKQFTREKRDYEPNVIGTGLGLYIIKNVVELMGGTITVNSEVGKGSEFIVELALEEVSSKNVNKEISSISVEERDGNLKNRRLLLCEDNNMNSQIAVRLLQKKDMIIDCAPNGQLGVEKFNLSDEGYYDAILMDIRMPVMDGLEAARVIRGLERSDSKKIPIIAMSANTSKQDMEISINAGMNAHLPKPFDPQELYNTLSTAISGKK